MKKIYVNNREFNGINRIFHTDIDGDSTRRGLLAALHATLVRWRLPPVVIYCLLVIFFTQRPFSYAADPLKLAMHEEPIEWIPFTYVCPVCGYDIENKVLNFFIF
jgi:hypothetical protein